MPNALVHPAEYWFFSGSVFFGSIAGFLSFAKVTRWGITQIRRWHHPPSLRVIAQGGKCAAVEIHHSGEPAIWESYIRILKVLSDSPNPNPLLRQCYLRKGGRGSRSLLLVDGESASIVLANIHWDSARSFRQTYVTVPNADDDYSTPVSGGAIIEVNFNTHPPIRKYSVKKCFQVDRTDNIMECTEVPCR